MQAAGHAILIVAGFLIFGGGLYDLLTPRLPANLAAICSGSVQATKLVRELLRALGGALVAIGAGVVFLVLWRGPAMSRADLLLVMVLVLPAEGVNAMAMRRVRSPWQIPAGFALLVVSGVILAAVR